MEERIDFFIKNNVALKDFYKYTKEELELIRLFINLKLFNINRKSRNILDNSGTDEPDTIQMMKMYSNESYDCLDYILSYRLKVDMAAISSESELQNKVNNYTNQNNDIQEKLIVLVNEVDEYNSVNMKKIKYLDVIDYILGRKVPEFKSCPDNNFFKTIDIIDLLYIHIILESDLINIIKINKKIVEANYLNISTKRNNEYYSDLILNYYKNKKNGNAIEIDLSNEDSIFKEKDRYIRIYKIATYYKYLIETEKIDIILKLREILEAENEKNGMKIRSHYFKYKYFKKVEELPYSKSVKEKVFSILNYILNYRYKAETPYIPINILIYSNDKESVEKITEIIGEFMWFFGYLPDNMKYYGEYANNIILDKFAVKQLYYEEDKKKTGVLLLHNFSNLAYIDAMEQNLILNILTDEIEKNNKEVCTIIYGDRTILKQILSNHPRLSQMLINLELEIDDLNINTVCELLNEKLEKIVEISDDVKEKIYNYVKATYRQSDIQNMEYINKLYNTIVFNMNRNFAIRSKQDLKIQNIPEAYNTRDLETILKDINQLIGLKGIKAQIYDLIALLKFNKKANIDIKGFNLHMVFQGNPRNRKNNSSKTYNRYIF